MDRGASQARWVSAEMPGFSGFEQTGRLADAYIQFPRELIHHEREVRDESTRKSVREFRWNSENLSAAR